MINKTFKFKHITVHEGPEKSPGFLLWHISTLWRSSIQEILKPLHLTHPQFVVLAAVGWLTQDGKHVTQSEVGRMAGLDPNTISQIMRGLEAKKLIKRIRSSDPRTKNPVLTSQGSALLERALPAVEKGDAEFFKILTREQLEVLGTLFHVLTVK